MIVYLEGNEARSGIPTKECVILNGTEVAITKTSFFGPVNIELEPDCPANVGTVELEND